MISASQLWIFYSYVATFQQGLHTELIFPNWYDILALVFPIMLFLIECCCSQGSFKTKSSKWWSWNHPFVILRTPSRVGWPLWNNRFTDDIGCVSNVLMTIPFPFNEWNLPNRTIYWVCNRMSNTAGNTCGAGSAYFSRAPEITPRFWWGSCCLVFNFLCRFLCTIIWLF